MLIGSTFRHPTHGRCEVLDLTPRSMVFRSAHGRHRQLFQGPIMYRYASLYEAARAVIRIFGPVTLPGILSELKYVKRQFDFFYTPEAVPAALSRLLGDGEVTVLGGTYLDKNAKGHTFKRSA